MIKKCSDAIIQSSSQHSDINFKKEEIIDWIIKRNQYGQLTNQLTMN